MSEKINRYVKFIHNEQKKLNISSVAAPRQLNEVQKVPGGGGAPGPAPRGGTGIGGMPVPAILKPRAPKKPHETWELEPKATPKKELELLPKEPTTSPSAAQAQLAKPRAEYKPEPLQVGTALKGAAGLATGAAAVYAGSQTAKEVEAAREPAPPQKATPPIKAEPSQPPPVPRVTDQKDQEENRPKEKPEDDSSTLAGTLSPYIKKPSTKPAESKEDDEAEKYLSPIERRARALKKEAVERLFSIKKPRI